MFPDLSFPSDIVPLSIRRNAASSIWQLDKTDNQIVIKNNEVLTILDVEPLLKDGALTIELS